MEITPLKNPVCSSVEIPGSKSYTNRGLILAALTKGPVSLKNPLFSKDTLAMIHCLRTLGLQIETHQNKIIVHDDVSCVQDQIYPLYCYDSGTTARFLLPLLCIVPGIKILQGSRRLNERPIEDLIDALQQLGALIAYCEKRGQLPVQVTSSTLSGRSVQIKSDISSQFCSSLLLISSYIPGLEIGVRGRLISKPYVEMTLHCIKEWKGKTEYLIEGDFSSAGCFFAIGALTKSTITVENLNPFSLQGDRKFLAILEKMGNIVDSEENKIRIQGKQIIALDVDMEDCPDQVMNMAVLAAFAKGVTKISGVRSLRVKETERVLALKIELQKMGIETEETHNTLTVYGGSPHPAKIHTYNDHRIAMAFAIAGTLLPGMIIDHPEVVDKTFPNFWEVLRSLEGKEV